MDDRSGLQQPPSRPRRTWGLLFAANTRHISASWIAFWTATSPERVKPTKGGFRGFGFPPNFVRQELEAPPPTPTPGWDDLDEKNLNQDSALVRYQINPV